MQVVVPKGTERTHAAIVRVGLRGKDIPCTISVESLGGCVVFLRVLDVSARPLVQAQQPVDALDVVFSQ
jgi:hypothetical protein